MKFAFAFTTVLLSTLAAGATELKGPCAVQAAQASIEIFQGTPLNAARSEMTAPNNYRVILESACYVFERIVQTSDSSCQVAKISDLRILSHDPECR